MGENAVVICGASIVEGAIVAAETMIMRVAPLYTVVVRMLASVITQRAAQNKECNKANVGLD